METNEPQVLLGDGVQDTSGMEVSQGPKDHHLRFRECFQEETYKSPTV